MRLIWIIFNTSVFLFLSGLHFYWLKENPHSVFAVLPETDEGEHLFKPGIVATSIVAMGLLIFALITAGQTGIYQDWLDTKLIQYGTLGIAVVFTLRTVGDFKYVGIFKTVRKTPFAINDTRYFVPLCAILSGGSFYLYFSN